MSGWSNKNVWILVLAAVIFSAVLAEGRSRRDLELAGAFFEILGDILGLLALQPGLFQDPEGSTG